MPCDIVQAKSMHTSIFYPAAWRKVNSVEGVLIIWRLTVLTLFVNFLFAVQLLIFCCSLNARVADLRGKNKYTCLHRDPGAVGIAHLPDKEANVPGNIKR